MDRKEFLSQVGIGVTSLLVPACIGGLSSCSKIAGTQTPTNVDFTIDTSTGALSANGGYLIQSGVIVARTQIGTFIAVSAACTHEGTNVYYSSASSGFICSRHGARYNETGAVIQGPASQSLTKYKTTLTGKNLRVYS
ncbi:MAG: Rieske (2Fe-2S) protein [Bacteroidetes bacterium]|nr:Rieske (2Fe-2S) protein [Bacteroidota bacterium]